MSLPCATMTTKKGTSPAFTFYVTRYPPTRSHQASLSARPFARSDNGLSLSLRIAFKVAIKTRCGIAFKAHLTEGFKSILYDAICF